MTVLLNSKLGLVHPFALALAAAPYRSRQLVQHRQLGMGVGVCVCVGALLICTVISHEVHASVMLTPYLSSCSLSGAGRDCSVRVVQLIRRRERLQLCVHHSIPHSIPHDTPQHTWLPSLMLLSIISPMIS